LAFLTLLQAGKKFKLLKKMADSHRFEMKNRHLPFLTKSAEIGSRDSEGLSIMLTATDRKQQS